MKFTKFITVLVFAIIGVTLNAQQTKKDTKTQEKLDTRFDNMGYWNRMIELGVTKGNPPVPFKPAEFKGTEISGKGVMVQDSPDVAVTSLTNVTQTENSIFVDPDNNQYVLNSNNSTSWNGSSAGTLYGADYLQTANGGASWGGSTTGAGGSNSGDPTTAINRAGRQFVGYITSAGGMGTAYSDNGTSWTAVTVYSTGSQDKNHMWIDNTTTSPYQNYLYNAWVDLQTGSANYADIIFSRSTNNGVSWSSVINLSNAINAGSHNQGVNIQTGPNGEVYTVWAVYDSWPADETAIGFAKSTNGGVSFAAPTRIITNIRGIRNTAVPQNMRVNSFPSMTVDNSGGPNNGNIYVVWTNIGAPGVNSGTAGAYMIRSTNGGLNWSTPVKINQGTGTAYMPWITCDQETGIIATVFYDNRNTATASCEAWVAYSLDAGATWSDFRVSDVSFTPSPISGLATGYMGDYLGITAKGGRFYPCWTDNRTGYMTYVSPFVIGLNATFTASITNVCAGNSVTYTDQSSGNPTSWSWSFPGGTPSSYSGQNPPAIFYNTPGIYNVSLTVSDGVNNNTMTKTGYITVQNIFADFIGSPTTVVVGNTVTFTDISSCNPTSWSWSFPGGTPSTATGQGPHIITYSTLGTYNASLIATNGLGNDTETKTAYINVISPVFNMTNGTITTCSGDFYDSGGSGGAYSNNENFTETFYPSTPGAMIQFTFSSFSTELNYDYLRIYNGTSTAAPLIGTYNGTAGPGTVLASNPSGAITFNFTSDGSITSTGWAASINCVIPTYPGLWTGAVSTVWEVGSNWDNGIVPTSGVDVTIPASVASNRWPTRTGDLILGTTCNNITMNGASELTITGNLTIPAGKTLTCTANSMIRLAGNWSNSGTFNSGNGIVDFNGTSSATIVNPTVPATTINNIARSTFAVGMVNLTGATTGPTGDNGGSNVSIGFTFNFDGANYTTARICTNGWLAFGITTGTSSTNANLFTTSTPNRILAPWWDDLSDDATSVVSYKTEGSSPDRIFTTEWKGVLSYRTGATERLNFQVKLYESSNMIEFCYGTVQAGTNNASESASIGIEDGTGGTVHFIEATTGSMTTGVSNLTSTSNWPTVNYRFSPIQGTLSFNNLIISKTGNSASSNSDINVLGNFIVQPGSNFTNSATKIINVTGNALFKADETGMASFINNGTFNVSGITTVQEYMSSERWHLVSPPVAGATINVYYDIYLKEYNEPTNGWTYLVQPTTIPMNVGQGYSSWASDNYTGPITVAYTGTLTSTNVNFASFSYSPGTNPTNYGFRLIGNPYPCAIDWNTSWPQSNLSGWAEIYDNGTYRGWHPTLGGWQGMTNGIIPSTQGFWVRALNASATLTIPTSARVHNSKAFYKDTQLFMYPIIRMSAIGNGFSDETVLAFLPDATDGFDGYFDLEKFYNVDQSPQLYSIIGDRSFAYNVMSSEYVNKVIPLGFENTIAGTYQMDVTMIDNFDPGINIYLEDVQNSQVTKLSQGTEINFDHNPMNDPHRFNLYFKDSYFGEKETSMKNVNIYAFDDVVYIEFPGNELTEVIIYNMMGQEMDRKESTGYGVLRIKIDAKSGYYLVKVQTGNQFVAEKVFIK